MPAKTEKQRRFIFAKRSQYKNKKQTPKKWKWIWGSEWIKLQESKVMNFDQFESWIQTTSDIQ